MQQSIDAFFELYERPVVGKVPDCTGHLISNRVFGGHVVPGVVLSLLHPQRDFLLLRVDTQYHHLDLVTDADKFARVADATCPGHLADVHQAFDAVFQFDECPVGQHVDDFAICGAVDRELLFDVLPRTGCFLLQPQSDLFFFIVDVQDHDFDFVVYLDHLRWMADATPAHVRNVEQAVDSTEIHKGSEVGDVLDGAFAKVAHLECFQKLFLHLLASFFDQTAAGHNDVAPLLIDLQNHALNFLTDVVADVLRATDINLARRQKDMHTDVDQQTTFDLAFDRTADNVTFVMTGNDVFPLADPTGLPP